MQLPFAARQHFLEHGYAVLPGALPAEVAARARAALLSTLTARVRYFAEYPTVETLLKRSSATFSDPLYSSMMPRVQRRMAVLRYYKKQREERRRLRRRVAQLLGGRRREELSAEELQRVSELLSEEVTRFAGRRNTATIATDPQMLTAINEYRANAWMTSDALRRALFADPDTRGRIATLAEIVGGVECPVVFGDVPVLRDRFGGPVAYQCGAPRVGVRTNLSGAPPAAVSLYVLTHEASPRCLAPHVLRRSHLFVREQYIHRVAPADLFSPFLPMESHIPYSLRHFYFDASVTPQCILPGSDAADASSSSSVDFYTEENNSDCARRLPPGTVIVADPHLMVAFGPNLTNAPEAVYQLGVIDPRGRPFLKAPSWVRGWRTMPHEINYHSPVVFPPLTEAATPPARGTVSSPRHKRRRTKRKSREAAAAASKDTVEAKQ